MKLFLRSQATSFVGPEQPVRDSALEQHPPETIAFRAFTATALVDGLFELSADRLTDSLNAVRMIRLRDARLVDLTTMQERRLPALEMVREELLLVQASGRRGSERRRFRAWPHAVAVTIGPYHVGGVIHTVPGADPTAIYHRQPMVPLTEATVSYSVLGRPIAQTFEALIFNRAAVTSISRGIDQLTERRRGDRAESDQRTPAGSALSS